MSKIIDFSQEDIDKVRSVISRYQTQLSELDRLTLENDRIRDELSVVKDSLAELSKEEEDLLLSLRSKYGDFPIQILKDYLV